MIEYDAACIKSALIFQDPVWRQTGRELQALAEDFARSRGRALVLQQAQQVNVTSLDKEKFCGLLEGLFEVNSRKLIFPLSLVYFSLFCLFKENLI